MGNMGKALLRTLLAAGIIASALACDAGTRVLDIKKKVIARGQQVKLGDLVSNYDVLSEKERGLFIMDAPTGKEEKTITIMQLAYMMQKCPDLMDVELDGPRSISVEADRGLSADGQFVGKAKSDIITHLKESEPWKDWKIDVLINAEDVKKISAVGEFNTLKVINLDHSAMLGSVSLRVAFLDDQEKRLAEVDIAPVIIREVNVAVMKETYGPGHVIEREDLKVAPVWMGQEKGNYIIQIDDYCGKELAKKMSAGEILRPGDLLDPVCAKRGDLVKIDCKSKNMVVSTMGKALQMGRRGDAIKVENLTSKKVFGVQLTGDRTGFISLD